MEDNFYYYPTFISMKTRGVLQILLADDDVVDRELFAEALSRTPLNVTLHEANDGNELFKLLRSNAVRPDIIFLDLNMPLKDGRETLRELKADDKFKLIPVIVLSTSNAEFDVNQCYQLGATLFISKPHDFHMLIDMLQSVLNLASRYISLPSIP
jgi:CheY-like chemotaxis protein